ncbi:MAG: magnetic particle specific iron-binding protein, partial [Magnetococcales bacterium]|nr:magnetic particle specific iron-binding protein [Magnetococcales bacterium]
KAGVAKTATAAMTPPPLPHPQTVVLVGTKSALAGTVAKAGGTIWTGTGATLGLGLGLGAWGPVLLIGVATLVGYGVHHYVTLRRSASAQSNNI